VGTPSLPARSASTIQPRKKPQIFFGWPTWASSAFLSGQRFAEAVRSHWAIENSLHWVLDVTFDEDRSRTRKRRIADNLSWLRRFEIGLLKGHPSEHSIKSKSRMAGWSNEFLMEVLTTQGV
jgi:hypothetical protein